MDEDTQYWLDNLESDIVALYDALNRFVDLLQDGLGLECEVLG